MEYAYVTSNIIPGIPYFSSGLRLGPSGVAERLPLPPMNASEQAGLAAMREELLSSIQKGVEFVSKKA